MPKSPAPAKGKDVADSRARYARYREDDRESERQRTMAQAMLDGEPPFPQDALNRSGAGYRANLNMGIGRAVLMSAVSAYTDLVYSPEVLLRLRLKTNVLDAKTRLDAEEVFAEEFTATIREWSDFDSRWEMLSTTFVAHGVSFAFFPNEADWRWDVVGLDNFKMPRQTKASEDSVQRSFIRVDYSPHELYCWACEDPETSSGRGWNPDVVEEAIAEAAGTATSSPRWGREWAEMQIQLKNNDFGGTRERADHIRCLHEFVRDKNGKISHYIFTENALSPKDEKPRHDGYLFKKEGRFDRATQAFVAFTANMGNGYFHGIRGLAYDIFPAVQNYNAQWCRFLDRATISSSLLLQPTEDATLDSPPVTINGPVGYVNPEMKFLQTKFPSDDDQMVLTRELSGIISNNSGRFRPPTTNLSKTEKTKFEVMAETELNSSLNVSQYNIFARSWKKLLTEKWQRFSDAVIEYLEIASVRLPGQKDPHCAPEILKFIERVAARGVDPSLVQFVDKVEPVTAVGRGSPAQRQLAYEELRTWFGVLDETGKNLAARDAIASRFGRDQTDRYLPKLLEPRSVIDEKVALLENGILKMGTEVPVKPGENHFVHLVSHLDAVEEKAGQFEEVRNSGNDIDFDAAQPEIEHMQAILVHAEPHLQELGSDDMREQEVNILRKRYQNLVGIVGNLIRSLYRWIQLQQSELQNAEGEADPTVIAELEKSQLKLRHLDETQRLKLGYSVQKAQLDMQVAQMKADQQIANEVRKRTLIKNPVS